MLLLRRASVAALLRLTSIAALLRRCSVAALLRRRAIAAAVGLAVRGLLPRRRLLAGEAAGAGRAARLLAL